MQIFDWIDSRDFKKYYIIFPLPAVIFAVVGIVWMVFFLEAQPVVTVFLIIFFLLIFGSIFSARYSYLNRQKEFFAFSNHSFYMAGEDTKKELFNLESLYSIIFDNNFNRVVFTKDKDDHEIIISILSSYNHKKSFYHLNNKQLLYLGLHTDINNESQDVELVRVLEIFEDNEVMFPLLNPKSFKEFMISKFKHTISGKLDIFEVKK